MRHGGLDGDACISSRQFPKRKMGHCDAMHAAVLRGLGFGALLRSSLSGTQTSSPGLPEGVDAAMQAEWGRVDMGARAWKPNG